MSKISLLLIATNKYKKFIPQLLSGVSEYFLKDHEINIHLFTDGYVDDCDDERICLIQHIIPSYKYPEATLLRYEIFTSIPKEEYDEWMIYLDVDMAIIDHVGDEILNDIIYVQHPGYYKGGWGDTETTPESNGFLPEELRNKYFAGGFQGGKTEYYYQIAEDLAEYIQNDRVRGIKARWDDETFWNKFIATNITLMSNPCYLNPSYCMPEAQWKREAWGVSQFKPIILALEKEEDIRE